MWKIDSLGSNPVNYMKHPQPSSCTRLTDRLKTFVSAKINNALKIDSLKSMRSLYTTVSGFPHIGVISMPTSPVLNDTFPAW